MTSAFDGGARARSRRRVLVIPVAFAFFSLTAHAERIFDRFDSGMNPNGWAWAGHPSDEAGITAAGGNPGGWNDSGAPYIAFHPDIESPGPRGSPLRRALDSGKLHTASIDIQRLDTTGVEGCDETRLFSSFIVLSLIDTHTAADQGATISALSFGAMYPDGFFPWISAKFGIPSEATDTPDGWVLDVPPGMTYTWQDMMHNIDAMQFFVGDPTTFAFNNCSHLGADNILVTWGAADPIHAERVFADGFEPDNP
jgi:hypothetical protein